MRITGCFSWFKGVSVTLHDAITKKQKFILLIIRWIGGVLFTRYWEASKNYTVVNRVIHNDIKSDNIVLAPSSLGLCVNPIIIYFGKACDVTQEKLYNLCLQEQDEYRVHLPQITPDLRD